MNFSYLVQGTISFLLGLFIGEVVGFCFVIGAFLIAVSIL